MGLHGESADTQAVHRLTALVRDIVMVSGGTGL